MSPTSRSLAELRKRGLAFDICETYNYFSKKRKDLFGIFDIIFLDGDSICGLQVTSGSNHSARRKKLVESLALPLWLQHGGKAYIHSWFLKTKGKRKIWTLREEELKEEFIS